MFGFGRKVKTLTGATSSSFLDKVDKAYQQAFARHNPSLLEGYMTRKCLVLVAEKIRVSDSADSGISRYRHVNWTKISNDPSASLYRREVTYDNINMSYGVVIPVGDSTSEIWEVQNVENKNLVSDIRGDSSE